MPRSGSRVRIPSPAPSSFLSSPDTWVTDRTSDMGENSSRTGCRGGLLLPVSGSEIAVHEAASHIPSGHTFLVLRVRTSGPRRRRRRRLYNRWPCGKTDPCANGPSLSRVRARSRSLPSRFPCSAGTRRAAPTANWSSATGKTRCKTATRTSGPLLYGCLSWPGAQSRSSSRAIRGQCAELVDTSPDGTLTFEVDRWLAVEGPDTVRQRLTYSHQRRRCDQPTAGNPGRRAAGCLLGNERRGATLQAPAQIAHRDHRGLRQLDPCHAARFFERRRSHRRGTPAEGQHVNAAS